MSSERKRKRITFKPSRPNPLFQSWLQELYDEAKEKGSKLTDMLHEALTSLTKYPLPLNSGAECAILKGFGKKLCQFLDQKLEAYYSQQCIKTPSSSTSNTLDSNSGQENIENENIVNKSPLKQSGKPKSPKKPKTYKPAYKSGGYAIMIALLNHLQENPSNPTLKKEELIEKAQLFSEESFTRPKPESHYTAWSNMSRLVGKGLINKSRSRKAEYSLTKAGILLANELMNDHLNTPSINDIIFDDTTFSNVSKETNENCNLVKSNQLLNNNDNELTNEDKSSTTNSNESNSNTNSQSCGDVLEMTSGSFDIVLLIDKNEISGSSNKNDPTVAQFKKYPDLKHDYRHLKVGDFTWVARSKTNADQELVLPYIVERKRMDDLGSSIKDGRFHEQKFRLRKCGLKNVMYLVESYGGNKHVGLPLQSLMQALANTRVQDGFKVHVTDSLTNTARFLAMMTKRLTVEYKDKSLQGRHGEATDESVLMTFSYFNKSSSKSKALTVKETFIKILLQLKGMSVEKALAITNAYETPKSLIDEYKNCSQKEGQMLLSNLKHGDLNRNVGPTVSKAIYQLLTIKNLQ